MIFYLNWVFLAGNGGVNGDATVQYGGGGFRQKADDGRKGRLGRVRSKRRRGLVESDFTCLEGRSFVDGPTNKNPKMVFVSRPYWEKTI